MADTAIPIGRRKQTLRETIVARRRVMTITERDAAALTIADHARLQWPAVGVVAAYLTVGSEPDTGPLIDRLVDAGATVIVPIITGEVLDWAEYDAAARLAAGPLGIREPQGIRLGVEAVRDTDLVVVPALAIDRHGMRLGRGRGYYDRALAAVTAPVVAVVYDHEYVDELPAEPHDRRVDAVLTPSGLVTFG